MKLQDKVAIITGGSSGIGRASALRLAQDGAKIAVSDVNVDGGKETVELVKDHGGEAFFIQCDVSKANEVEAMVNATVENYGRLDIALNNAGVGGAMANADQLEENIWDFVMNVNVKGVWLCTKYELPVMLKTGGGSIINVASIAGVLGFRGNSVYSASKHAVVGFTKSVALEYARLGIRVNAICPGFTETPMVTNMIEEVPRMGEYTVKSSPLKRLGRVEEIAEAVFYLASDMSSFTNGHSLILDGGASIQ